MSYNPTSSQINTGASTTAYPARMDTQHMSRQNKAYLINDSEFDSLGEIASTDKTIWSALAGSLSMILAAVWDAGYTPDGGIEFAVKWCIFWGLIAAVCGVVLFCRSGKRAKFINRIREESYESGPSGN